MVIKVGEKYPDNRYKNAQDGAIIATNTGLFDVIVLMQGLTSNEIKALNTGKFRYGVYTIANVPIWVFDFGDFTLDAPFNFHKVEESERHAWLETEANAVSIIGIERQNYKVVSLRFCGLDTELVKQFKEIAANQLRLYENSQAVEYATAQILGQYSTEKMIENTKMYTI